MAKSNGNRGQGTFVSEDLLAQRQYTQRLVSDGADFSLMMAEAFVRGIRDVGYKSTATAIDELIDNSIQAEAQQIHIVFGGGTSEKKPTALAIIDDGHGMDATMIRAAVMWGGTHRENDREGFGRYGYGLPSASVSQGKRFSVFSIVADGEMNAVTMDVEDIGEGKYRGTDGRISIPVPKAAKLPDWVIGYIASQPKAFPKGVLERGTVVLIEKLDRLTWKTTVSLSNHLLEHFGIVYRNFLRQVNLIVNGARVEAVDPLFITEGARLYDAMRDSRAEALAGGSFEVKDQDSGESLGVVKLRYSYIPLTAETASENRKRGDKSDPRLNILKNHNGIIVLRQGRQLDVVTHAPWAGGVFQNNDKWWKVEVDFPATLDEEFSVTTSKQQVGVSPRMWELLRQAGVPSAIRELRGRFKEDKARRDTARESGKEARASEKAMEEAQKFKTRKPGGEPAERQERAREQLEQAAQERAEETNRPFEQVEQEIMAEQQGRPYKLEIESLPGAPLYRVKQPGGQVILALNTAHRFYTDVYAAPHSNPRVRAALEILLFVMGECELEATDDRELFYRSERAEWSNRLNVALDRLSQMTGLEDDILGEEAGRVAEVVGET